jgi:hypothetical protein
MPAKYAGQGKRIRALCASDRAFEELWADYCEIVEMLEDSVTTNVDLRSLRVELEAEINEALGLGEAPG